jgi:ABC-type Fe3+/spermidine/putrescine transport system ATPase subunit
MTTSDRIAIMSEGRIEQIDDPLTLYNRPKTRYVAEFIGRSNILDGKANGAGVAFAGFDVPAARLNTTAPIATDIFSLRSQNIGLHAARPANGDGVILPGSIVDRAFLGETWDYELRVANSDLKLRVTSPPSNIFAVGQNVFVEIDPADIVPIQDDQAA